MSNYGHCKMGSQPVTETRTYGPTHHPLTGASQCGRADTECKITATFSFLFSFSSGLTPTAYSRAAFHNILDKSARMSTER